MSANEFFNKKKKGNWNNNNNNNIIITIIIIIIITTTFLRTIFPPVSLALFICLWVSEDGGVGKGAYLKGGLSKRVVKWAHQLPKVF